MDFKVSVLAQQVQTIRVLVEIRYQNLLGTTTEFVSILGYLLVSGNIHGNNTIGCWLCNSSSDAFNGSSSIPLCKSTTDMFNIFGTTGSLTKQDAGGIAAGAFESPAANNVLDRVILAPNYGIVCYDGTSYGGNILLNCKNTTNNLMCMTPTNQNTSSIQLFYNDVPL